MSHFVNPFTDKEGHSDNANDRGIVFDLYCQISSGEYIIVEMQNRWHSNFLNRTGGEPSFPADIFAIPLFH